MERIIPTSKSTPKPKSRGIIFGLCLFLTTFVLVLLCRIFVFAVYSIPSESMSPSILAGDKIIVNKTLFGPRIFNPFHLTTKSELARAWGLRKIKYNDVLVFNFPYTGGWDRIQIDLSLFYVKRCLGLPGDIVRIENGFFKIAGVNEALGSKVGQNQIYRISEKILEDVDGIYRTFPFDSIHDWTIKNFGPLHVPKTGDSIKINTNNFSVYKRIIEDETRKELSVNGNSVLLDGRKLSYYIFKSNYYFVAGDNSLDSQDSRYWGFLPEYCIIGIATHVWSSEDPVTGSYRFKRFLSKIK